MRRVFILLFACLLGDANASPVVRVALFIHVPRLRISSPQGLAVTAGGKQIYSGSSVEVTAPGFSVNGRRVEAPVLRVVSRAPFLIDKRGYRGSLEIVGDKNFIDAINVVDLEEYLYSVVGSEVSSRWPAESLKAQAVVARTYAVEKMGERMGAPFDVVDTTHDQMYLGISGETAATREAVDQTRGWIVTYGGAPIQAYYHSDCGGRTEAGKNVFPGDLPYLQSVVCPYGKDSPYESWSVAYTLSELSAMLGQTVRKLSVEYDPVSGRAASVGIVSPGGDEEIPGKVFRKMLGARNLRSTQFRIEEMEKTVYVAKTEFIPPKYVTKYVKEKAAEPVTRRITRHVIEYVESRLVKRASKVAVENLDSSGAVMVMYGSGSLARVDYSEQNPVIVVSEDGVPSTRFGGLSAVAVKSVITVSNSKVPRAASRNVDQVTQRLVTRVSTRTVNGVITRITPNDILEAGKKVTSWIPVKVPIAYTFIGKGWGHGVGLCQWGARGMALLGKTFREIIRFYYRGVDFSKAY